MGKYFKLPAFVVILLLVLTVSYGAEEEEKNREKRVEFEDLIPFGEAICRIEENYSKETDSQMLIYGALKGLVKALGDPYSHFMDPDAYAQMQENTKGRFGGLGIVIAIRDEVLTVISPLEGTPASRAGIEAGDKIVKIDGESTEGISISEAVSKLRGKVGAEITITIARENEPLRDVVIKREVIAIETVKDVKMLEGKVGYVRIVDFRQKTARDLEKALQNLEKRGMKGLILDLRSNPGGLLNVAVDVADRFIPGGRLIVYTEGRDKKQDMKFLSKKKTTHPDYPLVVLVNKYTASGSEIVAGAIQDLGRGIILGTETFGKGSVQTLIALSDGSAIRLTTSRYYTPKGRCIEDEKIVPDIVVENLPIRERVPAEEKAEEKSEGEEKQEPRDVQLEQAANLIRSHFVFTK
jgi:carboxyl-terminal processing protease